MKVQPDQDPTEMSLYWRVAIAGSYCNYPSHVSVKTALTAIRAASAALRMKSQC